MSSTLRFLRILLVAGVFGLVACEGEEAPEPSGPDFGTLEADQVMVDVEHYMTREGVRRAHLKADTIYLLDEGSTAHLRHFTVDFFGEQGQRNSVLTAVDGLYDVGAGDMRARDSVLVVDAAESRRLRTEELVYEASTDRLRSEADFVFLRGRDTTRGTGFVTDPGLDTLKTQRPSMVSPPGQEADGSGERDTARSEGSGPASPTDTAQPPVVDSSAGRPGPAGEPSGERGAP